MPELNSRVLQLTDAFIKLHPTNPHGHIFEVQLIGKTKTIVVWADTVELQSIIDLLRSYLTEGGYTIAQTK